MSQDKKYPEGHFVSMWMAIYIAMFSGIGIVLSIATGNHGLIGIGPALGVALGAAIGQSIENKCRKEGRIRPLTDIERIRRWGLVIAGLVVLLLGVGVLAIALA